MQDLYEKMLPTVCQTQGVPPCDHAKENVVLLERLLEVTEELQSANEAQKASTKEQVQKCAERHVRQEPKTTSLGNSLSDRPVRLCAPLF